MPGLYHAAQPVNSRFVGLVEEYFDRCHRRDLGLPDVAEFFEFAPLVVATRDVRGEIDIFFDPTIWHCDRLYRDEHRRGLELVEHPLGVIPGVRINCGNIPWAHTEARRYLTLQPGARLRWHPQPVLLTF